MTRCFAVEPRNKAFHFRVCGIPVYEHAIICNYMQNKFQEFPKVYFIYGGSV